jgi:hypothetical protein
MLLPPPSRPHEREVAWFSRSNPTRSFLPCPSASPARACPPFANAGRRRWARFRNAKLEPVRPRLARLLLPVAASALAAWSACSEPAGTNEARGPVDAGDRVPAVGATEASPPTNANGPCVDPDPETPLDASGGSPASPDPWLGSPFVDTSFAGGPIDSRVVVPARIAVDSGGRVYLAGHLGSWPRERLAIARWGSDGVLDRTWGQEGRVDIKLADASAGNIFGIAIDDASSSTRPASTSLATRSSRPVTKMSREPWPGSVG